MNSKNLRSLSLAALATAVIVPLQVQAQIEFPAASPQQTLQQQVGLTDIEIVYARPSIKDREIFGALVPYGQVWRTGANAATRITFSDPVTLNGNPVDAGTYGLFTIPGEESWTIILSSNPNQWGAYNYNPDDDVLRFETEARHLAEPVETFTIRFDHLRDESAAMILEWVNYSVPIDLGVNIKDRVLASIEQVMSGENTPNPMVLFRAAAFHLEHGHDLESAHEWITDAVERNANAFFIWHTKARIEAELGMTDEAIASAERSLELARAAEGSGGFVDLNERLLSELRD